MVIEDALYFDETETMPAEDRRKHQDRKMASIVRNAYRQAPAVRCMFDKAGILPSNIRTFKDLEKVPITRKNELIEMQKAEPPFGGLLAVPPSEVERIFISPGPIYEYQSSKIKWFARSFYAAGFRRGDIAVNTFTYHMSPAGILFQEGLRDCGATVVVMGTGNTDSLIKTMLDLKVTGFVGTPTFLMNVIKRIEETGYDFNRQFSLNKTWFTGEMLPVSLRKLFEGKYHLSTSQAYAVTEPGGAIAYECSRKAGLHLMDEYVVEIVDPRTGRQLGPGEVGEIVITPIHNKSWGLLRFGTGDLSSLITEPCSCGRTSYRIAGIVGRAGDAVKVRGMFIVTKQAEEVIGSFQSVAKFQIIVDRKDNRDEMDLRLVLKNTNEDKNQLAAEINQKFQDLCRLKLDNIQFVPPGAIPEPHKSLEDVRKWD
jgi:phenylacetate-CoA ligase